MVYLLQFTKSAKNDFKIAKNAKLGLMSSIVYLLPWQLVM